MSHAGKRLGIRPGTRSGLWSHFAYAIDQLRPRLVVIENVRGLLSAKAHSDVEPCAWCVGDDADGALRALGAVLGDLAGLGYDARWAGVRAADAGAPHGRFRVFVAAYPQDVGHEWPRRAWRWGDGLADSGHAPADPHRTRRKGRELARDGGARVDFGPYAAAIHRWELTLGRVAPPPTEVGAKGQPRLSPRFVEWMMGLPDGHVTGVDISRNDQLKALGNGVVPQQAELALRWLLHGDALPTLPTLNTPTSADSVRTAPSAKAREEYGATTLGEQAINLTPATAIEAQRLLPTPSVADAMGGHLTRSGDRSSELLLPGVAKKLGGAA